MGHMPSLQMCSSVRLGPKGRQTNVRRFATTAVAPLLRATG
jgi:hypothetical protein